MLTSAATSIFTASFSTRGTSTSFRWTASGVSHETSVYCSGDALFQGLGGGGGNHSCVHSDSWGCLSHAHGVKENRISFSNRALSNEGSISLCFFELFIS
jgi:hypothetical protein